MNLYAYVNGDPINRIDPLGLFDWLTFVACMTGMSEREVKALRGGVPDEILSDRRVADELTEEIGELKRKYGPGWKKARKKIMRDARKKAVERAIRRMGRKAALDYLKEETGDRPR